MRIMFVTYEVPHPVGGGIPIRDYNLLKHLSAISQDYRFTVVCFRDTNDQAASHHVDDLETFCEQVVTITRPQSPTNRWLRRFHVLERMVHPMSWQMRESASRQLRHEVRVLMRHKPCSVLHVNVAAMAPLLLETGHTRKVFGLELVSQRLASMLESEKRKTRRIAKRVELMKFRHYELNAYRQADLCISVSEVERRKLLHYIPNVNAKVIDNGVDTEYFGYDFTRDIGTSRNKLLFVGSLSYEPNHDAVLHFHSHVWPLLKARIPQLEWQIVGRNPAPSIRNLASGDIEVTGWVQDVRPFMRDSTVMIVPLLAGSGTRLKILEALALGMPVVSTSIGAEGLSVTHGYDILLADKPEEFAEAVVRIIQDPALARRLSQHGRRLVESQYDWRMVAYKLDSAYQGLFR